MSLRKDLAYGSAAVFLAADVFVADFAANQATFLHEYAHVFGHYGDRGFTDALTELFETVIRERNGLRRYERGWEKTRLAVVREREAVKAEGDEGSLKAWLAGLDACALRNLLACLPDVVMRKLRDGTT